MADTREILTLQFGNYANYVGAHWWNIQEAGFSYDPNAEASEINHDILYREGVDFKGQTTYTPRLLFVDLDGALNHLPEGGALYDAFGASSSTGDQSGLEDLKNAITWESGDIEVIAKEPLVKPEFQKDLDDPDVDITEKKYDFSENVNAWTDYLYTRYHPRSINIVKNYRHSNSVNSFDTFTNGKRIWETEHFDNDFGDKIRQYIEESNNCQGFQTIFDCTIGFSGFTLKCFEHLNDEYSKTNFAIPVFSPRNIYFENSDEPLTDSIRVVNTALTYSQLIEQTSLFLPLSTQDRAWRQFGAPRQFPHLKYQSDNLYQSSAILASYLDTISLRYRLKNPTTSSYLSSFCSDLTNYGRKLAAGALGLPFNMRSDEDLIDCLDKVDGELFTQISPNTKIGTDYVVQSVCIRGLPKTRLKRPIQSAQRQMKMAAYKCDSVSEMLQLYFQCANHASLAHVSSIPTSHPVRTPYPMEMFDQRLNFEGFRQDFDRADDQKLLSVPTIASIQCSGDLADTIESLHREASRIKVSKIHRFKETGMEPDDYLEALELLLNFKDNYEDNFDL